MKPVGIVSIQRQEAPDVNRPFDYLMAGVGHNTGNLLFTNAVWQQVSGPKVHVGFNFKPALMNARMRLLVIPAANWFSPHVDFSDLADRVEQLDIPVVMIGLGAQAGKYSEDVHVPDGTVRLIKAVAERSQSISVRGDFSRDVLSRYGVTNVTVTGCPSLYQDFQPDAARRLLSATSPGNGRTLLHATRYSARHLPSVRKASINRELYRLAYRTDTDLLLQSEPEEISVVSYGAGKPLLDSELIQNMLKLYAAPDWYMLKNYIQNHAKVFFDIPSWSDAMIHYDRVFGTRLHGTIMALNSGVPAILVHHDSRTREVCEFAGLPSINAGGLKPSEDFIQNAFRDVNLERYLTARNTNNEIYFTFLSQNGLEPMNSDTV